MPGETGELAQTAAEMSAQPMLTFLSPLREDSTHAGLMRWWTVTPRRTEG